MPPPVHLFSSTPVSPMAHLISSHHTLVTASECSTMTNQFLKLEVKVSSPPRLLSKKSATKQGQRILETNLIHKGFHIDLHTTCFWDVFSPAQSNLFFTARDKQKQETSFGRTGKQHCTCYRSGVFNIGVYAS